MIVCIAGVLKESELSTLNARLANAEFVDGKLTAGWHARQVKNNQQLPKRSPVTTELTDVVMHALKRNDLFQIAARPKVIRPPLFSRYQQGMSYGRHVDNAVMSGNAVSAVSVQTLRTDLSLTLFLNDPDAYEGGELTIEDSRGEQTFKLDAGAMVLYPSSTLHRVEPVTAGSRLVAVTWVQSMIRSPQHREILFDLDTARRTLFKHQGKTAEFDLLTKSMANLMRMWAEV
ncbi:MAG: Fe2+-dependent dioxygenase [Cyanobacteria bacterium P01_E01_bin.45]